jgi:hypothetical protein
MGRKATPETPVAPPAVTNPQNENLPAEVPPPIPKMAVGAAFLQLIASLKARRTTLIRWLGVRHYQAGNRTRKRNGRFTKGAMLDVKVD